MSEEKSAFTKDIEELVNKSIEANKVFMNEGTRLVKEFSSKAGNKEPVNLFQPELISNAFNAYAKLNLQHLKNMIDLGVSLAKQAGTPKQQDNSGTSKSTEPGPAFILKGAAEAGSKTSLQFVIDNVKEQDSSCTLANTDYTLQTDFSVHQSFVTSFTPQSFVLKPAASQTVMIDISIPSKTLPGLYVSNVQVKGFEPTYFSIHLSITEKQKKKTTDGSKVR
jgi:hypothetical protein